MISSALTAQQSSNENVMPKLKTTYKRILVSIKHSTISISPTYLKLYLMKYFGHILCMQKYELKMNKGL